MRDALIELPLPFEKKKIDWLIKKNKRRFVVNLFHYFFKTFNISKSRNAIQKSNFKAKDFIQAIFH
jgi:hypothetical protein